MAFIQVKDVLKRAVEFHAMLVDFYSRIDSISQKESVKLLVDYMARHEKILKEKICSVSEEQQKEISNEWMKYGPEYATCRCFEELDIKADTGVDDIVSAGLKLNQCLIDLYHYAAEATSNPDVNMLFANLELMEIAEKKKLARMRGL